MKTGSEVLQEKLNELKISQSKLAEMLGCTKQNVNMKFKRDSFTFTEFSNILSMLGYEIEITKKYDKEK